MNWDVHPGDEMARDLAAMVEARHTRVGLTKGHQLRIVILAHGHPDYSTGGGQITAYALYRAFAAESPDKTHLVSWIPLSRAPLHSAGHVTRLRNGSHEWLFHSGPSDGFFHNAQSRQVLQKGLVEFIVSLKPDVVHFHHFIGFGIDALSLVRLALPSVKIILTLHEFLSICSRDGQMITHPEDKLCSAASPLRCSGCFPQFFRSHFALREMWFKRHFRLVDGFIAPSEFLKERYVAWGLPDEKIRVIENAQACTMLPKPKPASDESSLYRTFSFFGQMNRYKGLDVLFGAAKLLREKIDRGELDIIPRILVYGTMIEQAEDFQSRMTASWKDLAGIIEYCGPYEMNEVMSLMSASGWVLVPSIWWENSPLVIEEAFHSERPVICSNIGGMKEKVTDEVNGLHFRVRDPHDLSRVLERCLREPDLWHQLRQSVRRLPSLHESAAQHRAYYQEAGE